MDLQVEEMLMAKAVGSCGNCGVPLNKGIPRIKNGTEYKSCPKCSVTHGMQHVYFSTPGEFGTTKKRISNKNPDGVQSYCESCRPPEEKDKPSKVYQNGITCSELN